jgi:N-acylneuraminate cytidylyltransferase
MVPFMKRNNEILCRQYLPEIYILNGALYVSNVNWLTKKKSFLSPLTKAYIMPTERSLDIDDQIDFEIAEYFLRNKKNRNR